MSNKRGPDGDGDLIHPGARRLSVNHHPAATRVCTLFEILVFVCLMGGGYYLLVVGFSNRNLSDSLMVLVGAVFIATGGMTLGPAIRSFLWHREMLRRAAAHTSREAEILRRELLITEDVVGLADRRPRHGRRKSAPNGGNDWTHGNRPVR